MKWKDIIKIIDEMPETEIKQEAKRITVEIAWKKLMKDNSKADKRIWDFIHNVST